MRIAEIVPYIKIKDHLNQEVQSFNKPEFDSRKIEPGDLFVAVPGTQVDGHTFISQAIDKGAKIIVCEDLPDNCPPGISFLKVVSSAYALGQIASLYYGRPSEELKLIAVTGTNGKTTITSSLYQLIRRLGYKTGLLSTIRNYVDVHASSATHTTPDSLSINKLIAEMRDTGCEYCFMEVSSHAIHQQRVAGLDFDGAVFSNLTQDHLDYHKSFEAYLNAKKALFDGLKKQAFALVNTDDKYAQQIVAGTKASVFSYSLKAVADYKTRVLEEHFDGSLIEINRREFWTPMIGDYNAGNLTAVYAVAELLDFNATEILVGMSQLQAVEGRLETIRDTDGRTAVVDYAHTPDALQNVLKSLVRLKKGSEKIITVVGAGGNRDKSKRPLMAKIAVEYSDKVIFT